MDLSISLKILLIILLLLGSALFVMAEFALVKIRPTRIEELSKKVIKKQKILRQMVNNLDNYLSITQLGITIVSLGLGWAGRNLTFFCII